MFGRRAYLNLCPKCLSKLQVFISHNLLFKFCSKCGYFESEYRPTAFTLPVDQQSLYTWLHNELSIASKNLVTLGHARLKYFRLSKDRRIGILSLSIKVYKDYVKSLRPYDSVYYENVLGIVVNFKQLRTSGNYIDGILILHTQPNMLPPSRGRLFTAEPAVLYESAIRILNEGSATASLQKFVKVTSPTCMVKISRVSHLYFPIDLSRYNIDQEKKNIINDIANLNDFDFLAIEGPPGTGKTTTIAVAVCELVKKGFKVLITSHTNVAIDNALEKIIEICPECKDYVVRLGHPAKIGPKIRPFMDSPREDEDRKTWILRVFRERKIFGMTIAKLAVLDVIYKLDALAKNIMNEWPLFDYIFIDEASMVPIGIAIIPIYYGRKWIILGDTRQLPPITRTTQGAPAYESILQLIVNTHPGKVRYLTIQRRGREEIFNYISRTFYQNRLITDKLVHNLASKLRLTPKFNDLTDKIIDMSYAITWIEVLDGFSDWIEVKKGRLSTWSAYNIEEAALAIAIYERLLRYGINPNDIAVITTYRAQALLVSKSIEKLGLAKPPIAHLGASKEEDEMRFDIEDYEIENLLDLRVSETVDSFQGREKPIILYSIVKHNYHKALANYTRFNVAISRAKLKLIILSSFSEGELIKIPWIFLLRKNAGCRLQINVRKEAYMKKIVNTVENALKELK